MRKDSIVSFNALLVVAALFCSPLCLAQSSAKPVSDQAALLQSSDPALARNKRLVYDFWREVFEAGHLELSEKYLTESYIQHNPNVASGRAAFVDFFSKLKKPKKIEPEITSPLVSIVAERDLVILSFAREYPEPGDPDKQYRSTWFDMFRIENGKIAEHWDPAVKK